MSVIKNLSDMLSPDFNQNAMKGMTGLIDKKKNWKEDETVYKPAFGEGGKKNLIWIRPLPTKFITEDLKDVDGNPTQLNMSIHYEHWYDEGTEKIKEVCPSTKYAYGIESDKCPICSYAYDKYPYSENETDDNKKARGQRKKKENVWINVYVEKDTLFPENEGRVAKMKLNFLLYGKFKSLMMGTKADENDEHYVDDPENPFDVMKGHIFQFIAEPSSYNKKYVGYDEKTLKWRDKKVMFDGDKKKILEVLNKTYDLYGEILKPAFDKVRSGDELASLMDSIYGTDFQANKEHSNSISEAVKEKMEETKKDLEEGMPDFKQEPKTAEKESPPAETPKTEEVAPEKAVEAETTVSDDESDEEFDFNPDNFQVN